MSIQHFNRKGQTFYLHQGLTKTGKPKYFFSQKENGTLVDGMPEGYEVYENPNAQVFLRKIPPKIITDQELSIVEKGMKKFSSLKYYKIDVKKNTIVIYGADQDPAGLMDGLPIALSARETKLKYLERHLSYSPLMQFVLLDEEKRNFTTMRYCFLGSVDDWIHIGKTDQLQNLVREYVKHLGQESYYSLHGW
ncbi:MAG: hypothetical protein RLZZ435_2050 [Cyanobacteriota bacterium]